VGADRIDRPWQKAVDQHETHHQHMWLYSSVRTWRARWRSLRGWRSGRRERR
jgi:hypothetical protein